LQPYLEQMKRNWVRSVLNLLVLSFFLAHVSGYLSWRFIERMENLAYDTRLLLTMPGTPDDRIVIVDIDEKSLAEEGRWPWPRIKMAKLMDRLFDDYEIALVGFDVVFAEPAVSSGLKVLEELADKELRDDQKFARVLKDVRPGLSYDQRFADSLKGRPVVLGYYFSEQSESGEALKVGRLPDPAFRAGHFKGRRIRFIGADGYGANLASLQDNAIAAGHFNPYVDEDGVVRRVPMLYEYGDAHYESLSLAVARIALGAEKVEPVYVDPGSGGEELRGTGVAQGGGSPIAGGRRGPDPGALSRKKRQFPLRLRHRCPAREIRKGQFKGGHCVGRHLSTRVVGFTYRAGAERVSGSRDPRKPHRGDPGQYP